MAAGLAAVRHHDIPGQHMRRDARLLWDDAPGSRRALAEALFERVEVLGLRRMRIEPTPSAVVAGLVEAYSSASAGYGRGERI